MAKVYVGTYQKYNSGSLKGAWLDLAEYENYDKFLDACRKVHKDEKEPEFMIQDSEGFPDGLDCMEWLGRADFDDVKKAIYEDTNVSGLKILDYSEKAIALVGDTRSVKDRLKKLGGRFNPRLSCGAGWIFSKKQRKDVEAFIATGGIVAKRTKCEKGCQQFIDWLEEATNGGKSKYAVGAIKMNGAYWFIEKPSIENRFCFHDEGPDYEFYKSLSNEERLAAYFKSKNLSKFNNKIERIEKGDKHTQDKRVWYKIHDGARLELRFYELGFRDNEACGWKLCTDEEKSVILKGLKFGRDMLEKRLNTYLKKYGVSKIHTWTYWADA